MSNLLIGGLQQKYGMIMAQKIFHGENMQKAPGQSKACLLSTAMQIAPVRSTAIQKVLLWSTAIQRALVRSSMPNPGAVNSKVESLASMMVNINAENYSTVNSDTERGEYEPADYSQYGTSSSESEYVPDSEEEHAFMGELISMRNHRSNA